MADHVWSIGGKTVDHHALREAQALERQHRKKLSMLEYERRQESGNARRVGNAIRKQVRQERQSISVWISIRPKPVRGSRSSSRTCRRIEVMAGLLLPARSHRGSDGLSSFHFKWTGRGLGKQRKSGSHAYRAGEAVRHVQYILREHARELGQGGLVSNISLDPDELASIFSALEELEMTGRDNANVFISIVISLPHELTAEQREELLARICAIFGRDALPHIGILHGADPDGDQRNTHAHIMLSLRPMQKDADGGIAFAPGTCSDLNDKAAITALRAEIAGLMNEAMVAAGQDRRFTALSNKERGLPARTKRDGKNGPGRNDRQRRQIDLDLMKSELGFRQERIAALSDLEGELAATLALPIVDRDAAIRVARERAMAEVARPPAPARPDVMIAPPQMSTPSIPSITPSAFPVATLQPGIPHVGPTTAVDLRPAIIPAGESAERSRAAVVSPEEQPCLPATAADARDEDTLRKASGKGIPPPSEAEAAEQTDKEEKFRMLSRVATWQRNLMDNEAPFLGSQQPRTLWDMPALAALPSLASAPRLSDQALDRQAVIAAAQARTAGTESARAPSPALSEKPITRPTAPMPVTITPPGPVVAPPVATLQPGTAVAPSSVTAKVGDAVRNLQRYRYLPLRQTWAADPRAPGGKRFTGLGIEVGDQFKDMATRFGEAALVQGEADIQTLYAERRSAMMRTLEQDLTTWRSVPINPYKPITDQLVGKDEHYARAVYLAWKDADMMEVRRRADEFWRARALERKRSEPGIGEALAEAETAIMRAPWLARAPEQTKHRFAEAIAALGGAIAAEHVWIESDAALVLHTRSEEALRLTEWLEKSPLGREALRTFARTIGRFTRPAGDWLYSRTIGNPGGGNGDMPPARQKDGWGR